MKNNLAEECVELFEQISEKNVLIERYENMRYRVKNKAEDEGLIKKIEFQRHDIQQLEEKVYNAKQSLKNEFLVDDPDKLIMIVKSASHLSDKVREAKKL